jgi:hypothetical protein
MTFMADPGQQAHGARLEASPMTTGVAQELQRLGHPFISSIFVLPLFLVIS